MKLLLKHEDLDPDVAPLDEDEPVQPGNAEIHEDAYLIGGPEKPAILVTTGKRKKPPKPWVKPAAYGLCAVFVGLTAWNLSRMIMGPAGPPAPTPFQIKQTVYMGVMKVDGYRRAHGVTPESLKDVDLPDAYTYRRISPDQYALSFRSKDGRSFEYDSSQSKEAVFGPPQAILTMGESR